MAAGGALVHPPTVRRRFTKGCLNTADKMGNVVLVERYFRDNYSKWIKLICAKRSVKYYRFQILPQVEGILQ